MNRKRKNEVVEAIEDIAQTMELVIDKMHTLQMEIPDKDVSVPKMDMMNHMLEKARGHIDALTTDMKILATYMEDTKAPQSILDGTGNVRLMSEHEKYFMVQAEYLKRSRTERR